MITSHKGNDRVVLMSREPYADAADVTLCPAYVGLFSGITCWKIAQQHADGQGV